MSYCRFSDESDVYMIKTNKDKDSVIECCMCSLRENTFDNSFSLVMFMKRSEAISHLNEHKKAGDKIIKDVFQKLTEEIDKYGDVSHWDDEL